MPLVSVLMPTFNQAKFLTEALLGLDAQTFRDFELIACNDGSTDGTAAILDFVGVRTVTHPVNRGAATAINTAAAEAAGSLLTWVSSDNVMRPEWLEVLVKEMDPGTGAVYSAYRRVEDGQKVVEVRQGQYDPERLVGTENCYYGPSFLIRREVWQPHRGLSSHDYDSWARVEEACWAADLAIRYIDEVLADYRAGWWCTARARPELYDADKWRAEAIERRRELARHHHRGAGSAW